MNLIRKENDGGYLSFFISIPLGAQDQLPTLQEPVKNKSVGHKTKCGIPCSRNSIHFKTGRTEVGSPLSVGPFSCRGHRPVEQTLGDLYPHP